MSRSAPKRRASSQERIDRILEATTALLDQGGLSALSIYAIAEQADIYAFVLTTTRGRLGGAGKDDKPQRSPRRPSLLHPPPKNLAGL